VIRFAAAAVALAAALPARAAPPADPLGEWATKNFESIFELYPCAQDTALVCGKIAWLWDPVDAEGRPVTDRKNDDPALRGRPLAGTELMKGFRRENEREWTGGTIYNPDDGRTYSASFRLKAPGVLEFTGCALGILCGSQVWRRPDEVLDRARQRN
jgi:uncharacterized protein (DUF2147 family)